MGLAEKLSEIDHALDGLGVVPNELSQRIRAQWGSTPLDAIDQELQALSAGVTLVDSPSPRRREPSIAPTSPVDTTTAVEPVPHASETPAMEMATATPSIAPAFSQPPALPEPPAFDETPSLSEAPEAIAPMSFSDAPADNVAPSGSPFSPTLPSTPPPAVETTVGLGERKRTLTMSEPPLSGPPPAAEASADVDPFEGKPAPIPVPSRAPSVWPMAPAPKRSTTRTIRTSAAPPPPLPPSSMRPRSMSPFPTAPVKRPSDTPDPFAPINRASSRPPATLDADQLFGGISSTPPRNDGPVDLSAPSAPPAPRAPSLLPQSNAANTAPPTDDDDFELMVDDEMMEIDVEEIE